MWLFRDAIASAKLYNLCLKIMSIRAGQYAGKYCYSQILTNNGMTFYAIPNIVWFVTEIIVLLGGH